MPKAHSERAGGAPETRPISVTEFTRRVKNLLEGSMGACWVKGEVSNLRIQPSGHVYFSLKDAGAQLSAVMFRMQAARQTVKLRDGLQVVALGDVGVYEARGQYQLVVRTLVDDGVGALQREYEALKRRLSEEGLFDAARKKPLPQMPGTVGFVTSPTGAAVQDFLRILIRRGWRGRVVVLPAKVQGEGAAAEMVAMLGLAGTLGIFDLIVIGRGGGSIEDLWAFNEEILVRAVAACPVPTISAVGHEIDFTLCDFAADLRAETPSAAAELVSSEFVRFAERTESAGEAISSAVSQAMGALEGAPVPRALAPAAPLARRARRARPPPAGRHVEPARVRAPGQYPPAAPATLGRCIASRARLTGDPRADRVAQAAFPVEAAPGREPALRPQPGIRDREG